jgi:hypothetical protein
MPSNSRNTITFNLPFFIVKTLSVDRSSKCDPPAFGPNCVGCITTQNLANGAVTTPKIAPDAASTSTMQAQNDAVESSTNNRHSGDDNWWLGSYGTNNQLNWSFVGNAHNPSGVDFGHAINDGRPFWIGDFNGEARLEETIEKLKAQIEKLREEKALLRVMTHSMTMTRISTDITVAVFQFFMA